MFWRRLLGRKHHDHVCVPLSLMNVTSGAISVAGRDGLLVDTPAMRADFGEVARDAVGINFRYLGPTIVEKPLASGEVRRQIGLKLRSQNTCNLVYVMWRMEPVSEISVSVKYNPGMTKHGECGDRGYQIMDGSPFPVSAVRVGDNGSLQARIKSGLLQVWVNGELEWEGQLPVDFPVGASGIRSDNVRAAFQVRDLTCALKV